MNILPKKCAEFKSKDYWNKFFSQLKNTEHENFQWYGNYHDFKQQLKKIFKHILHKNSTQHDQKNTTQHNQLSLFQIGCGKSTFGEDIFLDYPQFNIINTDYSEEIIKDMIKRSLLMKTMCRYEVCDMFQQLNEKYHHRFDAVLDKGTLDAILPEDQPEQIAKIKSVFFRNVQLALNPHRHSAYIIISMLQPFVLRTIIQHFHKKPQYEIQIQQAFIKDSNMQPFLIFIKRYPDSEKFINDKISLKLLKGNKELFFTSTQQTMQKIALIQDTVASQQSIKKLSPNRILAFDISNPNQQDKVRYKIQIVDNQESKLLLNNCAAFIVPQGKENSYYFRNQKGLKKFIQQVGTSRLIVIKLMPGNTFKSIQSVKNEINPLIQSFIQEKCEVNNVPFMTDAEQLGSRKIIYQNEKLYVQEIGGSNNEAYRRVIFKNNLGLIQTNLKLVYEESSKYAYAKDNQTKTKILPAKKGKYIVIDNKFIDEGYCQQIVAGLVRFCQINQKEPRIMVLGAGGYSISKFMFENVFPCPHIVNVEKQLSLCEGELLTLLQVQHYLKTNHFKIINQDAYQYETQNNQQNQFSSIIVDIAGTDQNSEIPPKQFISTAFLKECYNKLDTKNGGVFAFNILKKGFVKNNLAAILNLKLFDLGFVSYQDDEEDTKKDNSKEQQEEDCMVLFLLKLSQQTKTIIKQDSQKLVEYGLGLIGQKDVGKGKKEKKQFRKMRVSEQNIEWVKECAGEMQLIYPVNKSVLKF